MRNHLLLLILFLPLVAQAGVPKLIDFDSFKKERIEFESWYDFSDDEISAFKEGSSCQWLAIFIPHIDAEHPEFKRVASRVELRKEGKLFSFLDVAIFDAVDRNKKVLSVCVPYELGLESDITYSYNPVDTDMTPMCPPSFKIKNIEKLLRKTK